MGRRELFSYGCYAVLGLGGTASVSGLVSQHSAATPFLVWGGLAAMVIALVGLFRLWLTAPKVSLPPALQAIVEAAGPPPREFLDPSITPKLLMEKIAGRTSLQIQAITRTYSGKWMRISGAVYDVCPVTSEQFLLFLFAEDDQLVSFVLPKSETERFLAVNTNDRVTAIGKLTKLQNGPSFIETEIEHIDGPAPKAAQRSRSKPKAISSSPADDEEL